jgi:tetratricopeptide (TPR) repeat protein
LLHQQNRATEEIAQLEVLSSLDPRPSRRIALGLAQAEVGRRDLALGTLKVAAERYPEYTPLYVALGRIWLVASRGGRDRIALSKAIEALEGAATSADETHEAQALFGRALYQAADVERAERVLQQSVSRLPVDPEAFVYLADAAEQLGHLADARAALLKYQALTGDDQSVARQARRAARIGELSVKLGDYPTAVRWLARAVDGAPPTGRLLAELAGAQVRAGDLAGAKASIARGLEIEPRNRTLAALSRRLR